MKHYVAKGGAQLGPYEEDQVRLMLDRGEVSGADLGWHPGMKEWLPLQDILVGPPPVPVSLPTPDGTMPHQAADIAIVLVYAERWKRLVAISLDVASMAACILPGLVFLIAGSTNRYPPFIVLGGIVTAVELVAYLVYQGYLLTTLGQTIGKRLLRIKIVTVLGGTRPGFVRGVLLRYLLFNLVGGIIKAIAGPGFHLGFKLADNLAIFREDRRCWHDWIAGTIVVNADADDNADGRADNADDTRP